MKNEAFFTLHQLEHGALVINYIVLEMCPFSEASLSSNIQYSIGFSPFLCAET
jgi:hypothetical protein